MVNLQAKLTFEVISYHLFIFPRVLVREVMGRHNASSDFSVKATRNGDCGAAWSSHVIRALGIYRVAITFLARRSAVPDNITVNFDSTNSKHQTVGGVRRQIRIGSEIRPYWTTDGARVYDVWWRERRGNVVVYTYYRCSCIYHVSLCNATSSNAPVSRGGRNVVRLKCGDDAPLCGKWSGNNRESWFLLASWKPSDQSQQNKLLAFLAIDRRFLTSAAAFTQISDRNDKSSQANIPSFHLFIK